MYIQEAYLSRARIFTNASGVACCIQGCEETTQIFIQYGFQKMNGAQGSGIYVSSRKISVKEFCQRWSVALGACRYTIEHRSAKHIQQTDSLSRHSHMSPPDPSKDCLLIKPVPINRTRLIQDTRRYFGVVMKSLRTGWRALIQQTFTKFYAWRCCNRSEL